MGAGNRHYHHHHNHHDHQSSSAACGVVQQQQVRLKRDMYLLCDVSIKHAHRHIKTFPITGAARAEAGGHDPRNWVHKKIPGCAVELNTQNCAWFGSQISL